MLTRLDEQVGAIARDKYVPKWMGKDALDGLCFHPPWVRDESTAYKDDVYLLPKVPDERVAKLAITIAAIIITCSPFFSQQLISDYSYSRGGGAELFPITVTAAVAARNYFPIPVAAAVAVRKDRK